MKTKHSFLVALVTFLAIGGLVVSASAATAPKPLSCSLMGTWSGWADHDWSSGPNLAWTAVQSAGNNNSTGGIEMSWVRDAGDMFGPYLNVTTGHGLWKANGTQFNYTWYAYLIDNSSASTTYGQVVASIRAYGLVSFPTDCNHAAISYIFDVFEGKVAPDQMTYDNIAYFDTLTGIGGETRAPLAIPAL